MRGRIRMRAALIAEVCGIALIMAVAMLAGANAVRADEAAKKVLTPEMAITLQSESDLHFSPEGSRVAFVVTGPLKDTARKRHIWVLDVAARKARQLTYSEKSEFSPSWSHDGHTLAFLSDRGTDTQIYFMSMDGGEGHAVTDGKRSIQSFEWSPDGKQIAFIAPLSKDRGRRKEGERQGRCARGRQGRQAGGAVAAGRGFAQDAGDCGTPLAR